MMAWGGGEDGVSVAQGQGLGKQVSGTYQRGGRGDLSAPGGTHHHEDLSIAVHDDRWAHG